MLHLDLKYLNEGLEVHDFDPLQDWPENVLRLDLKLQYNEEETR